MNSKDWFRNTDWNAEIEKAFFEKLRRARDKSQYIRIQASTLASSNPEVALKLLEHYFALGDKFDYAQAYVDQATAYLAMGELEKAIDAYEAALTREAEFPNLQTQANMDLPFLIALHEIEKLYDRALQLLDIAESKLMFPLDHFRWHASKALIKRARGRNVDAMLSACEAVVWAEKSHSGFPFHPTVGLVGGQYEEIRAKLKGLCHA